MVKFTYIYSLAGFSRTPGLSQPGSHLAYNKALPNRPHNPTDSPHTPLLHISGLSPERGYMLNDTIIHFLHVEPSILRLIRHSRLPAGNALWFCQNFYLFFLFFFIYFFFFRRQGFRMITFDRQAGPLQNFNRSHVMVIGRSVSFPPPPGFFFSEPQEHFWKKFVGKKNSPPLFFFLAF